MGKLYPDIINADERLSQVCLERARHKWWFRSSVEMMSKLKSELEIIKSQGSASGYLSAYELLSKASARKRDYLFRGAIHSSIVAYILGLSNLNPLYNERIPFHPEFFYGIDSDKQPTFEMTVNRDLYYRILEVVDKLEGIREVKYKYDDEENLYGAYLIPEGYSSNLKDDELFYINFCKAGKNRKDLFATEIEKICEPVGFEECVKCFGLSHGTEVWDKDIYFEQGYENMIGNYEDVYDRLLGSGIEKRMAYNITEDIRFGRINKRGWNPSVLQLLREHGIPEWYLDLCKRIKYLFPRIYGMAMVDRYNVCLQSSSEKFIKCIETSKDEVELKGTIKLLTDRMDDLRRYHYCKYELFLMHTFLGSLRDENDEKTLRKLFRMYA